VFLLKRDACAKGDALVLGVLSSQITREDKNSLIVTWSAQMNFSFDVYDTLRTCVRTRGNAFRKRETQVASIKDCKAVDLFNLSSLKLSKQYTVLDKLVHFFSYKIRAKDSFLKRARYVFPCDQRGCRVFFLCQIPGLMKYFFDRSTVKKKFCLLPCRARTILEDLCNATRGYIGKTPFCTE
jgi:hypothetical protein